MRCAQDEFIFSSMWVVCGHNLDAVILRCRVSDRDASLIRDLSLSATQWYQNYLKTNLYVLSLVTKTHDSRVVTDLVYASIFASYLHSERLAPHTSKSRTPVMSFRLEKFALTSR